MVTKIEYNSKRLASLLSPPSGKESQDTEEKREAQQSDLISDEQAPEGLFTPRVVPKRFSTFSEVNPYVTNEQDEFTCTPLRSQDSPRKQRRKKKSELESLLEGSPLRSTGHDVAVDSSGMELTHQLYSVQSCSSASLREPRITRRVSRLLESGLLDTPGASSKLPTLGQLESSFYGNPATIPSFLLEARAHSSAHTSFLASNVIRLFNNWKDHCFTFYSYCQELFKQRAVLQKRLYQLHGYLNEAFRYTMDFIAIISFWSFCLFTSAARFGRWVAHNRKSLIVKIGIAFVALLLLRGIFFKRGSKSTFPVNQTVDKEISLLLARQSELEREIMNRVNGSIKHINELFNQQNLPTDSSGLKQEFEQWIEKAKHEVIEIAESKINLISSVAKETVNNDELLAMVAKNNSEMQSRIEELNANLSSIGPTVASLNSKITALRNENQQLTNEVTKLKSMQVVQDVSKGAVDYALVNQGAYIAKEFTSPTYKASKLWSFFGVGIEGKAPETMLSSNNSLGNCWSFAGSSGHAMIVLGRAVVPTAFAIEHVPSQYAVNPTTAPRELEIYGLTDLTFQKPPVLLCKMYFDISKSHLLEVPVLSNDVSGMKQAEKVFQYFRVNVLSNNGCTKFTCVYKIKIYGNEVQ